MKRIALALIALLLMGAAGLLLARSQAARWWALDRTVSARFPSVERVTTAELAERLHTPAPPLLLDTRPPEEFAVSHLPGALRVDPDAAAFPELAGVPRGTPIVTYCSVGWRSAAVAERLEAAGFTDVRNLEGSIFRWANQGRTVVRGDSAVREVHPYDEAWGRMLRPELHAYRPGG